MADEYQTDVAIIGGGPASAFAAIEILKAHKNVEIFEEHKEIGVPVNCAGLISVSGFEKLGIQVPKDCIQHKVKGSRFYSPSGHTFEVKRKKIQALVIDRAQFDKFLINKVEHLDGKVHLNGTALPPPSDCSIGEARILVDFSDRLSDSLKYKLATSDLDKRIGRGYRLGGGISQHLMLIAQGTLHGGLFWGIGRKGKFWDIAAASLILETLGLKLTNLEGKTIHPTDTIFDQLVVATPFLHQQLLDWVAELKERYFLK